MNINDIQRVSALSNEKLAIQAGLGMLDTGGKISAMTVSGGQYEGQRPGPLPGMPGMMGGPATVQTDYITYPPQMVEAIKAAFEARLHTIEEELSNLGVTGLPSR